MRWCVHSLVNTCHCACVRSNVFGCASVHRYMELRAGMCCMCSDVMACVGVACMCLCAQLCAGVCSHLVRGAGKTAVRAQMCADVFRPDNNILPSWTYTPSVSATGGCHFTTNGRTYTPNALDIGGRHRKNHPRRTDLHLQFPKHWG